MRKVRHRGYNAAQSLADFDPTSTGSYYDQSLQNRAIHGDDPIAEGERAVEAPDRDPSPEWIETAVRLAEMLGLNPIKARWRLEHLRSELGRARLAARTWVHHLHYPHRVCPRCGRIEDRNAHACGGCGEELSSRPVELLRRFGLRMPDMSWVSFFLGMAMIAIFARMLAVTG